MAFIKGPAHFFNKSNYKKCANKVKQSKKDHTISFETRIIKSNNLGTLYKHINSRLTHKSGIAPLCDLAGNIVTDDSLKANLLNSHFVKVGTTDDGILPPFDQALQSGDVYLDKIYFESSDVYEIINSMNPTSSPGPEGFPPTLLSSLNINSVYHCLFYFPLFFNLVISLRNG